ncbi:unnamed protein product [Mycena citricolor]|uniref:DNA ligase 1 n=1 Tax=Mycena citricolor TaxID=2018698 RepID=A0AAD2GW44_9AGAR|nr:unnamed protein product [Mycena citricolor]
MYMFVLARRVASGCTYLRMGRQQTLGKFFDMPKSTKAAPPQQSSLAEMWGRKKQVTDAPQDALKTKSVPMEVDSAPRPHIEPGSRFLKEETPSDDVQPESSGSKRKENATDGGSRVKRRRIIDSHSEDDGVAAREPSPSSSNKLSPPKSLKSRGKAKAIVKSEEDEAEPAVPSADEGEDEVEIDDEMDSDLDTPDAGEASKIAEAALARRGDVDVKGGWKVGTPVPYAALTKTFALIEATTKRLEKTALLTSFLYLVIQRSAEGDSKSLLQAVYLCINRLSPDYVGVELGIGESLLIKAIGESTGRSLSVIKADLKKEGDLGLVAMVSKNSKNSQKTLFKPKPLTLPFVFQNLRDIALTSGHSSQAKKVSIITKLLAACQDFEAKYIVRSLEGKLRIGNAERSVIIAIAHAAVLAERDRADKKWSNEKLSKRLQAGADTLKSIYRFWRSSRSATLNADHFEFQRTTICLKDSTESFVLDAEAVAFDRATGKLMPFQELSRRKRKDVKVEDIQIRVCLFAFDLLYLNGEPLIQKPLAERRRLLRAHFEPVFGEFDFAKSSDGETTDEIQTFLEQSVKDGCEGLMVKMMETDASYYEPSRRSVNWLKVCRLITRCARLTGKQLKKDYLAGVGDSLDLVVVGGYYGKGKRTNVYGAFLLACYDPDSEEFQTICKIGTGFSEEALQSHYNVLQPLELTKVRGDIKAGGAKPDVWFEPQVVWEVLTADLSLSPIYTAAQGLVEERGISLRFPRFVRIRDDKSADDSTTPEQVAEMYESQALAQSKGKKKRAGDGDDDFW